MKRTTQMSETIRLGLLLAASGGFMDAYSYLERDHVFANAQTGNMLLFGVYLSQGSLGTALRYLVPVLAFAVGIAVAELIHIRQPETLHWRQISVLMEAVILAAVAFFPLSMNLPANSLTSFACGIQVESFRKIRGNGIATTMCIGNMRSGTQNLCSFFHTGDRECLHNSLLYYGIIVCFVAGAVAGSFAIQLLGERAVLCCSLLLLIAFLLMFVDYEHATGEGWKRA